MSRQVLPFYLVCDESGSMSGAPIKAINDSLPKLHGEIGSNPIIADKTRFCLISFSSDAQVLLPLVDLSSVTSMPMLQAGGETSYRSAFNLLYDSITADVAKLKADGNQVYRPAVFFLSDGQPTDDWVAAYQRVTDAGWPLHPNILAFGFGSVDQATLQQVATVKAFITDGSMGPEQALRPFVQSLIGSIVSSGTRQGADGGLQLSVPDDVPGFTTLSPDSLEPDAQDGGLNLSVPDDVDGFMTLPADSLEPDDAYGPGEPVPAPEQRLLQGRFPERVRLGEEVTLLVRLGLQPGARLEAGLRPLAVPETGLDVVLLLAESPGFTLRSPGQAVVHVVPRQDSSWAGFELQAAREGVHTLQVEAFVGGTGLGGLAIQVSVDPTAQTGPSAERSSPAAITQASPGQISLLLSYDADQQVYRYRLVDSSGYYSEEAASDRLLQPPGEAIEQLVAQVNMLARGQVTWDAGTTKAWLKGQGIALWDSFIPQALQREFWRHRDQITQMTIVSPGDPVPWELLYPFAPDDHDAGFLIDQFPVARRRYGPRPPSRLQLGAADLVLSGDSSLAAAPAEIAALEGLLRGQGLTPRHIGDLPSLLQTLQRADVGLLHFTCHNAFARGAPNASRILLGTQPFEPAFLTAHAGRFVNPLVFVNACRTDGQAPLYTTVEGWASSFLRAGAGAFIGSLWEAADSSASTYAQEFYRAVFGGKTLGESARQARDAIRDKPGDPTWLAYTLYGDPAATVSTPPAPGR